MVSYEVIAACPDQLGPMFIEDIHICWAACSTACACVSKRPAIARIACGSVIKRVAMLPFSFWINFLDTYRLAFVVGRLLGYRSRRSRVIHRQSFPSLSTGRRRIRYHAGSPRHVEPRFGFALPLAPF